MYEKVNLILFCLMYGDDVYIILGFGQYIVGFSIVIYGDPIPLLSNSCPIRLVWTHTIKVCRTNQAY